LLLGTIVNTAAIVLGGVIGLLFGQALSAKVKATLTQGIGLAILLVGGSMALQTENVLVIIASLVLGGAVGELLDNRLSE